MGALVIFAAQNICEFRFGPCTRHFIEHPQIHSMPPQENAAPTPIFSPGKGEGLFLDGKTIYPLQQICTSMLPRLKLSTSKALAKSALPQDKQILQASKLNQVFKP